MNTRDAAFKVILIAAIVILLVDKTARVFSGSNLFPNAQTDDNRGNIIHNSRPTDSLGKREVLWHASNPAIRVLSGAGGNETDTTKGANSLQRMLSTWMNNFLFRMRQKTGFAALSGSSSEKLDRDLNFEYQTHEGGRGYCSTDINGVDVSYHNPFSAKKVRGVALLIHGCGQQAEDWFKLPEHRHIAAQLIRKGLALFAVTSGNHITRCWSTRFPYWQNDDVERVTMVTRQWMMDLGLSPSTPLHAVGISSGGTMLSVLSSSNLLPNLASQALYISPGNQRAFRNATRDYPNTLFIHTTTDHHYASPTAITSGRQILLKRNVALVGELALPQVPLTPRTVHEREPRISEELSRKIYATAENELGDLEKAMRSATSEELAKLWADRDSRRALRQVIRVVHGLHEVSATYADRVAAWLVRNGRHAKR